MNQVHAIHSVPDSHLSHEREELQAPPGPVDTNGIVEFRAHHQVGGQPGVLHEESRFRRHDGEWRYVRGRLTES